MANNESIKSLEIRASIALNLAFPCNTNLSCFFLFFLLIVFFFLIPEIIAKIFNPTAELVIPTTGIPAKEAIPYQKHNQ